MKKQFTAPTLYFLQEGRENLRECLNVAFHAARQHNVSKIVIFTARGEGVRLALDSFCTQPDFGHIQLVAVRFPAGMIFTDKNGSVENVEIPASEVEFFKIHNIPIVRAHLPLDPIAAFYKQRGVLGQDLSLVGEALNMFGGSMSLCVEAIILACDAGLVEMGEHAIALTSDTAILVQASSTARMLEDLRIRELLCKPAVFTISRNEVSEKLPTQMQLEIPSDVIELPADVKELPEAGGSVSTPDETEQP
jgi:hypothetical protein